MTLSIKFFASLFLTANMFLTVSGQISNKRQARKNGKEKSILQKSNFNAPAPIVPLTDHHTHIWSFNASALITDPLLSEIELPAELKQLLRKKEQFGGKDKNPAALADLYTKDTLVLNPSNPSWLRGQNAIAYITNSTQVAHLVPTAYEAGDSNGYVAGYEAVVQGSSAKYVSNFLYVIRKETDGKWRIASETFTLKGPTVANAITTEQLIKEMDTAGVKRAAVLSVAFWYGKYNRKVEDEYVKVRAENDWVAEQIAAYPDRLIGFCSFNPLKDYAIEELNRCAQNPGFKGLKLHFGNSGVDVLNPQHVEKLRVVFRTANERRLPIIVHLWTSGKYGREQAEAFLNQIIPAAPDIPIQIAHMAASGPNYHSDEAFEVYATAAARHDPRMKNVYTDVASMVTRTTSPETLILVAKRLRQFGIDHVLFGSDRSPGFGNESPKEAWESFKHLPLTEREFRKIAGNLAPYEH